MQGDVKHLSKDSLNYCLFLASCSSDIDCISDYQSSLTGESDDLTSEEDIVDDESFQEVQDEANDISQITDSDWRLVAVGVENADLLCVRLNELIRRGKVKKEMIVYKYLNDVVEFMYDPRHQYDGEVDEFFNMISYLGGRRAANMN